MFKRIRSFFSRVSSRYKFRREKRLSPADKNQHEIIESLDTAAPMEVVPVQNNQVPNSPSDDLTITETENQQTLIFENMSNNEFQDTQSGLPPEFDYLKKLIDYRLTEGQDFPTLPPLEDWSINIQNFFVESKIDESYELAMLLLIGLAPHVYPELFDHAIQEKLRSSGDFPEIGGVRGKNFRGFLPTGQTAIFLMAGTDTMARKRVEQQFWPDKELSKKKILWLEDMQEGEPVLSGKIILATEFIDRLLHGQSAPPDFSTSFPAKRITTKLKVDDIVLNDEVKAHYDNLKDWIENNIELTNDWDKKGRLKRGFKVLFYGPPGTGKTLTANVLGNETGLAVYKIDLSMVVSKYIGETEKNLERLFARAEENSILFFDEADAIFGKRTSVRDAHDKYANQEVSYLLQRIEEFAGLVILATNMKNNIDTAFLRRFNDIVRFSIPDEDERKEIWEKSFPENATTENIPNLVKKYELTGANIINAVHFAGIQAVKRRHRLIGAQMANVAVKESRDGALHQDNTKLKFHLEDVTEGIKRELFKEGRPFPG